MRTRTLLFLNWTEGSFEVDATVLNHIVDPGEKGYHNHQRSIIKYWLAVHQMIRTEMCEEPWNGKVSRVPDLEHSSPEISHHRRGWHFLRIWSKDCMIPKWQKMAHGQLLQIKCPFLSWWYKRLERLGKSWSIAADTNSKVGEPGSVCVESLKKCSCTLLLRRAVSGRNWLRVGYVLWFWENKLFHSWRLIKMDCVKLK